MMRIRALRLSDVGRFRSPIAVEGFGDGLNVLSGPNELGKSTLLGALEALFKYTYKQSPEELRALRPNGGGNPVIEAEFEAEGRLWRLRKQFLTSASTVLESVTDRTILKNAEAEAQLAAIKKAALDFDRFGLLWVRQGELEAPCDNDGSLGALIASEVDAVSLDARARAIQALVRKDLFELQTEKTAKPRGNWLKARQDAEREQARLARAEASVGKQTERLDTLAKLDAERASLLAPQASAARSQAAQSARLGYARAEGVRRQRTESSATLSHAEAALLSAERDAALLDDALAKLDKLARDAETAGKTYQELSQQRVDCERDAAEARAAVDTATTTLATLRREFRVAEDASRAHQAGAERDQLAAHIADVRATMTAQQRARAEIASMACVTGSRIKELHAAHGQLLQIEAAMGAVVPEVSIALEPSAAGRIFIDGKALTGEATLNPDAPLTIEIVGIGRIVIAPNPATVGAAQRSTRERLRAHVETLLAEIGASTSADADARLTAKTEAEAAEREATVKVNALAPRGIDALVAAHGALAQRAATAPADFDPAALATFASRIATQEETVASETAAFASIERRLARLREDIVRVETANAARCEQVSALERQHGDAGARQTARLALAGALATARANFTSATTAADAWEANRDADRVEAWQAELSAAEHALKAAEDRVGKLSEQISGIEGELRAASDEDVETELETARAAAAAASARLAEIEAEVAALNLLERQFQLIADAGRRELSGPILRRIQPYLTRIFGNAVLELGDKLAPAQLLRNGQAEAHAQLSRGTREQIAILVRLGLAHLLADRGAAVPLILDDALVYADDQRIAQMFEALRDSARLHQVIVLNCREQTFAALSHAPGSTILSFKPWVPSALAA